MSEATQIQHIYVVLAITAIIVGGATAYLRLYVAQQMTILKDLIESKQEARYVQKELLDMRLLGLDARLKILEDKQGC